MIHFTDIEQNLEAAHSVLSERLKEKLKTAIFQTASRHLKNRVLKFDHAMGSITLDIGLRGENGYVSVSDSREYSFVYGKAQYMAYNLLETPCIKELILILGDYSQLGPCLQASAFEIKV